MRLLAEALAKFACGLLMVGLLIFLPAGTMQPSMLGADLNMSYSGNGFLSGAVAVLVGR